MAKEKARLDHREWVNDMAVGALAGVVTGAVAALLVPDPPFRDAMFGGGITGLVYGLIAPPLKHLLNRRPDPEENADET